MEGRTTVRRSHGEAHCSCGGQIEAGIHAAEADVDRRFARREKAQELRRWRVRLLRLQKPEAGRQGGGRPVGWCWHNQRAVREERRHAVLYRSVEGGAPRKRGQTDRATGLVDEPPQTLPV